MKKLQVTVSDDLCRRIDVVAERFGTTRSALCGVLLGQSIAGAESALSASDKMAELLIQETKQTTPNV